MDPRSLARLLLVALAAGCSFETQPFSLGNDRDAQAFPEQPALDAPALDAPALDAPALDAPALDVTTGVDGVSPDVPPVAEDAAGCGTGSACGIGTSCCGGRCIDVQADPANCGACGNACTGAQRCCAGACQDPTSNANHCGACNTVCDFANAQPACRGGQCAIERCAMGYGNCNNRPDDGCETELGGDSANCGTCGNRCAAGTNATATCSAGQCGVVCNPGFADCDRNAANGCETNVASPTACGACGNACPARANASAACTGGACGFTCNPGFADCDGVPDNGCEVNTNTSAVHCGSCGVNCARPNANGACQMGTCVQTCLAGFANCDGDNANGCERPVGSDPANCGACGRVCPTGQFCSNSVCTTSCAAPTTLCGAGCVDPATDVRHCGACNRPCPAPPNATAACVNRACGIGACTAGFGDCDGNPANGCETNLNTSVQHCGACRDACSTTNATPTCMAGNCALACATGFADCDRDDANGCETSVRSNTNCGACGRACATANATATCATGTCAVGNCNSGFGDCDRNAANGCETNTQNDNANCGGCGTVCRAGTACSRGVCSTVCASGLTLCAGRCVDLQADRSNCGSCGNACVLSPFPLFCNAGRCGLPTPANDTCANATEINLAAGTRIDLAASTVLATHHLDAPCFGVGGADVFYRFTLTRREVVYADTFGASFDTKLFFASSCTAPLTRTPQAGELLCDDNRGANCIQGGTGSQVVAVLSPGTYFLVLSVQAGAAGSATLHFEHLPAGNGTVSSLGLTAGRISGTTSGTSAVSSATCGGSGPEATWFWTTCPGSAGGTMTASTCTLASFNTVLHVSHGEGRRDCNNDVTCGLLPTQQSTVSSPVPAGAGLHLLYVDGYGSAAGSFSVNVNRPASQ